jgi:hypothetical protein
METQGIEEKIKEKFICVASVPMIERIGYEKQTLEIPSGAEWVKTRRRKINFYKGTKPKPNGYTRIPERAITCYCTDYRDRIKHVKYGELKFT